MILNRINRQPRFELVNSPEAIESEIKIFSRHELTNQLAEYMIAQKFNASRVDDVAVGDSSTEASNGFTDTGWMSKARCKDTEFNNISFFPKRGEPAKEAKQVCARCPVRMECLTYALENREEAGVWGGASAKMREPLVPIFEKLKKQI